MDKNIEIGNLIQDLSGLVDINIEKEFLEDLKKFKPKRDSYFLVIGVTNLLISNLIMDSMRNKYPSSGYSINSNNTGDALCNVFLYIYNNDKFTESEKKTLTKKLQKHILYNLGEIYLGPDRVNDKSKKIYYNITSYIQDYSCNPYYKKKISRKYYKRYEFEFIEKNLEIDIINNFGTIKSYKFFLFLVDNYKSKTEKMKFRQIFHFLRNEIVLNEIDYIKYIQENYGVTFSRVSNESHTEQLKLKSFRDEFNSKS